MEIVNDNLILDAREYMVQYPDGLYETLTYAKLVEYVYS